MEILNENCLKISSDEILDIDNLRIKEKRKIKSIIIPTPLDGINIRQLSELLENLRLFPLANYYLTCSYSLLNTIIAFNNEIKLSGLSVNVSDEIPDSFEILNLEDLNFNINLPLLIAFLLPEENILELDGKKITIDYENSNIFLKKYHELKLSCERIKQDIDYDNISNADDELKKWLDTHTNKHDNDESSTILSQIIYYMITKSKPKNKGKNN
jgi:hypothetical protein